MDVVTSKDSTKDKVMHTIETIPKIVDHISAAKVKKSTSASDKVANVIETTGKISESVSKVIENKA